MVAEWEEEACDEELRQDEVLSRGMFRHVTSSLLHRSTGIEQDTDNRESALNFSACRSFAKKPSSTNATALLPFSMRVPLWPSLTLPR